MKMNQQKQVCSCSSVGWQQHMWQDCPCTAADIIGACLTKYIPVVCRIMQSGHCLIHSKAILAGVWSCSTHTFLGSCNSCILSCCMSFATASSAAALMASQRSSTAAHARWTLRSEHSCVSAVGLTDCSGTNPGYAFPTCCIDLIQTLI